MKQLSRRGVLSLLVVILNFVWVNLASSQMQRPIKKLIFQIRQGSLYPPTPEKAMFPLMSIFSDGEVVDHHSMKKFKVSTQMMSSFIEKLRKVEFFNDQIMTRREWLGPDAEFIAIEAAYGKKRRKLVSWHPIFERNPNVVVTDHGVELLEGRDRNRVLDACSPQYKRFRKIWADVETLTEEFLKDAQTSEERTP